MSADKLKREIGLSLEASFWLKKAVVELDRRDPVDALADAEALLDFCKMRCRDVGVACHADIPGTQNMCTRDAGHEGEHRCKAEDVDRRLGRAP